MDNTHFSRDQPASAKSRESSSKSSDIGRHSNSMHASTPVSHETSHQNATSQSSYAAFGAANPEAGTVPIEFIDYSTNQSGSDRNQPRQCNDDELNTTNMHLRRRAQNRASQRAFRERKEKHVKLLEDQIQHLQEQHQLLLQSYSQQTMKVSELNERIEKLMSEISLLQSSRVEASTPYVNLNDGICLPDDFGNGSDLLFNNTYCSQELQFLSDNMDISSFSQFDEQM